MKVHGRGLMFHNCQYRMRILDFGLPQHWLGNKNVVCPDGANKGEMDQPSFFKISWVSETIPKSILYFFCSTRSWLWLLDVAWICLFYFFESLIQFCGCSCWLLGDFNIYPGCLVMFGDVRCHKQPLFHSITICSLWYARFIEANPSALATDTVK